MKYTAQMENYIAIISGVYSRPAKGVLAYAGLVKAVEI